MLPTFTTLGAGPTLLMLHGIDGGHLSFSPQVERFAQAGWRAVAWDMPGYGYSAPIEPYNFKGLAQRCIALIEALQARAAHRDVVLLGHDIGGMVAQEVVFRRPELVNRLILCGTWAAFEPATAAGEEDFLTPRLSLLGTDPDMATLAATLVPRLVGPSSLPEGARLAGHCLGQVSAATYRRALQALPGFERRAELSAIAVPVLLLTGEFDRHAGPRGAVDMAQRIVDAQAVVLPGVGHLPHLEDPTAFDAAVLDFLTATEGRAHRLPRLQ